MTDDVTRLLEDELLRARRAGDRAGAAAVRTTLADIANAEAVPVEHADATDGSAHVAGGRFGVGAAEAPRRELSAADRRRSVAAEISALEEAARWYDGTDVARAEDARRGAALLADVLDRAGTRQ